MEFTLDDLLSDMVKLKASDLHVSAGSPPIVRVRGKLTRLKGYKILSSDVAEGILTNILTGFQNERLFEDKELDFSYSIEGLARFRGNIFRENQSLGGVFRMIPHVPESLERLGIPIKISELALKRHGFILVTGPSGSGKTTTLAALVDFLNSNRNSHIVTVEDPIEYVFQSKTCLIRQREVGSHTKSFARALKSTLRQDPDVILVGEMRDLETIETALTAAETGHLVISTLHTNNAVDTIGRIIDVFAGPKQEQVRVQLSSVLLGVFSQLLIPHKKRERGMVLATEALMITQAIRNMIRENRIHMIRQAMETGTEQGMQTMEHSLKILYEANKITLEDAQLHAYDLDTFNKMIGLTIKVDKDKPGFEQTASSSAENKNKTSSPFRKRTPAGVAASNSTGDNYIDDKGHYYRDPLYADSKSFAGTYFGNNQDDDEF